MYIGYWLCAQEARRLLGQTDAAWMWDVTFSVNESLTDRTVSPACNRLSNRQRVRESLVRTQTMSIGFFMDWQWCDQDFFQDQDQDKDPRARARL